MILRSFNLKLNHYNTECKITEIIVGRSVNSVSADVFSKVQLIDQSEKIPQHLSITVFLQVYFFVRREFHHVLANFSKCFAQ